MGFSSENRKNYLFIDSFKGVLKEILLEETLNLGNSFEFEETVSLEVFLENNRTNPQITEKIPLISETNSHDFQLVISLSSVKSEKSSNETINFKEILGSFNQNSTLKIKEKLHKQVFLKEITEFIRAEVLNEGKHKEIRRNSMEIARNRVLFEVYGKKLAKMNQKIKFPGLYADKSAIFIVIFQGVFTIKPKQVISLLFCERKSFFLAFIYDTRRNSYFKQKIRREKAKKYIPFLEEMVKLGLFFELGERIFKTFKNSLLACSVVKNW